MSKPENSSSTQSNVQTNVRIQPVWVIAPRSAREFAIWPAINEHHGAHQAGHGRTPGWTRAQPAHPASVWRKEKRTECLGPACAPEFGGALRLPAIHGGQTQLDIAGLGR